MELTSFNKALILAATNSVKILFGYILFYSVEIKRFS